MTDPKLVSDFESFLREEYPNFNVEQVVELQDYVRFVLVDDGDFEGLTDFVSTVCKTFNAKVELRRESTKSFQLEILLPKAPPPTPPAPKRNTPPTPWIPMLLMTCLTSTMGALLIWLSRPS
jgi:hypothetical protein